MYIGKNNPLPLKQIYRHGKNAILRILPSFILIFASVLLCYSLLYILPGDSSIISQSVLSSPTTSQKPAFFIGFFHWFSNFITGDMGTSAVYGDSVSDLLTQRIGVTLPLAISSFMASVCIGIPFGIVSAYKKSLYIHNTVIGMIAIPPIWLGFAFVYIFAVALQWLPSTGADGVQSYILPTLTIAIGQGAIVARITKMALQSVLHKEFLHAVRLRGLSPFSALLQHGIPAISGSLLGLFSLQLGFLISGVVVIEKMFAMPGIGDLMIQSILLRDIPLASATVMTIIIAVTSVNGFMAIIAWYINPILRKGYTR